MSDAVAASGIQDGSLLHSLSDKMTSYLVASRSDNTIKSYFNCFKRWEGFIKEQGFSALPAQPIHVALYITHLLESGSTCNTINSVVYSLKWVHQINDLPDPTANSFIVSLQDSAKRVACPQKHKKDPVNTDLLIKLCNRFADSDDLLVIRDLTMILLSYAGFLRYDEISSLLCRDVKVFDDYLTIYINKSKTDQYRHGNEVVIAKGSTVACPLNMFNRYVKCSDTNLSSDYYLFRPVFRSKSVCKLIYKNKKLSYTAARQGILTKLRLIDNTLNLGLHSMRSGGATAVANSNVNDRCWKRHGRWRSDTSKDGYVADSLEKRLEVTQKLGL